MDSISQEGRPGGDSSRRRRTDWTRSGLRRLILAPDLWEQGWSIKLDGRAWGLWGRGNIGEDGAGRVVDGGEEIGIREVALSAIGIVINRIKGRRRRMSDIMVHDLEYLAARLLSMSVTGVVRGREWCTHARLEHGQSNSSMSCGGRRPAPLAKRDRREASARRKSDSCHIDGRCE